MDIKHPSEGNQQPLPHPPAGHPPSEEDRVSPPDPSPFSLFGNILATLIFIMGLLGFSYLIVSMPPLSRVDNPDLALSLTVSRALDLEAALEHLSPWEKWIFDLMTGGESSLAQAILWYEELVAKSQDPITTMNLAILRGEAGKREALQEQVKEWRQREDPYPIFYRLLQTAYGNASVTPDEGWRLQAELVDVLPAGWFYDQVALRLSKQGNQQAFILATEEATSLRVAPLLAHARQFIGVEVGILFSGILAGLIIFSSRQSLKALLKVGAYPLPPPWSGRMGILVLLRGGAGGVVMFMALLYIGWSLPFLQFISLPLLYLPLLILTSRYLLYPAGRGVLDGFGFWPVSGGWKGLLLVTPLLITGLLIIEWILGYGSELLGISIHWTEWFDPDLAWGDWYQVGTTMVEYVLFAPVLEEMAFRGILFGTFRRRFSFAPAAMMSGLIFAAAHGYGLLGFISVWLSGLLWAWGYEKTGSLLPGILAHAVNNLIVCVSVLMLVR